jgi:hypothetical protein
MCGAGRAGAAFLRVPGQTGNIAMRGTGWAGTTGWHRCSELELAGADQ